MSVSSIEKYSPQSTYYSLQDKLWGYVVSRSEKAFKAAEYKRDKIKTIEDLEKYTEEKRKFFIDSLGGIPYDNTLPLNAKVTGVIKEEGLRIEKVVFESRPKVYVTVNLYIPEKRKNPCGAVLFQIGHAETGKSCSQYQKVARIIASCGVIVMVMDPVGQGERLSYYETSSGKPLVGATVWDHQYAGEQCVLTGDNIARYFIADAMRAVDYLVSRPEVDSEKIGATGSSGGGTATCYLMLCDSRVKAAAPGTFVTTRKEYLYSGNAQDSEQIWFGATENGFDHHELVMSFAPKPLLLLVVDSDFFAIEGTEDLVKETSRFWKMYEARGKFSVKVDKSQHNYTNELAKAAGEFFAIELNGEERIPDDMVKSLPANELWCTVEGQVKIAMPDAKFVYDENLDRYNSSKSLKNEIKDFLTKKINYMREKEQLRLRTFSPICERNLTITPYMWFAQRQMPNWGLLFTQFDKTPTESVICLWDRGTDSIEEHIHIIRKICREGKAAFLVDLSGMGKCAPHGLNTAWPDKAQYGVLDKITKDLFFLGDSLCALRLFELRYIVDEVCNKLGLKASIYAEGNCSAYARLYKEIDSDVEITLYNEVQTYKEIVESKYYEDYNIAGILMPGIAQYCKD